jgi:hypothetical protein
MTISRLQKGLGVVLLAAIYSSCVAGETAPDAQLKVGATTQNLALLNPTSNSTSDGQMVIDPSKLPARSSLSLAQFDPFYDYTDAAALKNLKNGAIIRTRSFPWTMSVPGFSRTLNVVQILYRTTDAQEKPTTNVTTLIRSIVGSTRCLVSYQSAYDSLNPLDSPSVSIKKASAPGFKFPADTLSTDSLSIMMRIEVPLFANLLSATGCNVIIPDTEGQNAAFAHGVVEGRTTLDSIRAALYTANPKWWNPNSDVGLHVKDTVAVLVGYSGGAIATAWAASLAGEYAPELLATSGFLDRPTLAGASLGGLLIDPIRNLQYVNGTEKWGVVAPLALIGMTRGAGINLGNFMNAAGQELLPLLANQNLAGAIPAAKYLRWDYFLSENYLSAWQAYLAGKGTGGFGSIGKMADDMNLAARPAPRIPIQFVQGGYGDSQGSPPKMIEGAMANGDGVMLAPDAVTLSRKYCNAGTPVQLWIFDALDHAQALASWGIVAVDYAVNRVIGLPPISNCLTVPSNGPALALQYPVPH